MFKHHGTLILTDFIFYTRFRSSHYNLLKFNNIYFPKSIEIFNVFFYFSILSYNSFYDSSRKQTVHETFASFGTGQALIDQGIPDPIIYLEEEVKRLNFEKANNKATEISGVAPFKYAGHFPLKFIIDKLNVEPIFNVYDLTRSFHFRLFDVLSALIYARCIKPCSKYKTYFEVIPYLEKSMPFPMINYLKV